jgi:hypothetical protein
MGFITVALVACSYCSKKDTNRGQFIALSRRVPLPFIQFGQTTSQVALFTTPDGMRRGSFFSVSNAARQTETKQFIGKNQAQKLAAFEESWFIFNECARTRR